MNLYLLFFAHDYCLENELKRYSNIWSKSDLLPQTSKKQRYPKATKYIELSTIHSFVSKKDKRIGNCEGKECINKNTEKYHTSW